jgi:abnormal spindle-like microcephaly-associated protein
MSSTRSTATPSTADYGVLKDDLAHPELYEENWLEHQEIALTQLLNTFFSKMDPSVGQTHSFSTLRSKLIRLYNEPDMPHLSKRLQASLTYGSLTVTKELLAKSLRLKDDVGQRRRFLNIFLEVYDLTTLQAAAEAIVGRECIRKSRSSTESVSELSTPGRVDKRSIEHYLDLFFIQHSDVSATSHGSGTIAALARDKTDQAGSPTWAWRRTVIRSLMLVLLMDKSKSEKIISGCLFQASSPFKSSEAVVKALGTILIPSYGDLMRPLRHMKYDVVTEQNPMEEFDYHVDNIATDLRDGIRLTRVIDILLARNHAASICTANPADFCTLSQHLKHPCASRTQKLQNVMVALSALVRLPSMPEKLLKDISAFDIVDGHREKTLSLIWALLGQYAMDSLVEWDLVKKETMAAQTKLSSLNLLDPSFQDVADIQLTSTPRCWTLLFEWAKATCALHSIRITNLTTSFAGPAAFAAITNTYLASFPSAPVASSDLSISLRAIGCSAAFSALLSSPLSLIPTRDFTLSSLTFLAARLLPASRAHRAASVIQASWRRVLGRREVTRRVNLMRLAAHCAAVVNARDRVVAAATVLQRAWRGVLERRMGAFEARLAGFQAVARGWLVRSRGREKKERSRRAGW